MQQLLKQGQAHLSNVITSSTKVGLLNEVPDETVHAYLSLGSAVTHNAAAVDDDPGASVAFDSINMRNQAQTHQIELAGTDGMTFSLGLETGVTLSLDVDDDSLPDAWEVSQGIGKTISTGINGADGDANGDGMTNRYEFITGRNLSVSDPLIPIVTRELAGFKITFATIPDRLYRVYSSDNLQTWAPLGSVILGNGGVISLTDPVAPTWPKRFYRVEVSLTNP